MAVLHKQCSNKPIYLPFHPVLKKYGGTGRSPRNKLRSIGPSWTYKTAVTALRSIESSNKKNGKSTCKRPRDILRSDGPTRRRFWVLTPWAPPARQVRVCFGSSSPDKPPSSDRTALSTLLACRRRLARAYSPPVLCSATPTTARAPRRRPAAP